jgi:hypothetical protein
MTMPPQDLQPELALLARTKHGDEAAFGHAKPAAAPEAKR